MRTFKRIAFPLVVSGLLAGTLTGVLSAQTARPGDASRVAEAANRVEGKANFQGSKAAARAFAAGLDAYRAGDMVQAISHWETAAGGGHLGAQWNLARIFSGQSGQPADPRRRLHYLQLAAAQHDPEAPPSPYSAVTIEALVELGRAYMTGVPEAGLPEEPERARGLFEHAASLFGNARAQHYLGLMYARGEGVRPDMSRAVRWLFLAARKEHAPSQAALGDYFWKRGASGSAGTEDRMRGMMWFALASENAKGEDARAIFLGRYKEAMTQLDEAERERVRSLVAGWNAGDKPAALAVAQQLQYPAVKEMAGPSAN